MNSGMINTTHPYFSIIIPVFNGESYIDACLNSILDQRLTDYEVIILDGCSTDGTVGRIQAHVKKHQNIKFFSRKDKGVYDAMNFGITESLGTYLYFMGCDDTFFDKEVLVNVKATIVKTSHPDLIYGNVLLGQTNYLHNGEYDLSKLYYLNICHQSIFYARSTFMQVGHFDLSYPAFADWHYNFKCFSTQMKIQYMTLIVARYAMGGLSTRIKDPLIENKRKVFIPMARNASRYAYFSLRKNTIDSKKLLGKAAYLYYHLLAGIIFLLKKATKGSLESAESVGLN